MKLDVTLIISIIGLSLAIFSVLSIYLSNIRLRDTIYRDDLKRVDMDRTRLALEADIRKIYDQIYRDSGRWDEINHLLIDSARSSKFRTAEEQIRLPIDAARFLKNFGIDLQTTSLNRDQVFILTPLGESDINAVDAVISSCKMVGLIAIKGDESKINGSILPVVISEIVKSRFVIANLNGRNPNVFYEMGIAQALGKDVLMFSNRKDIDELPFDVAQQQIIFYRTHRDLHEKMNVAIAQLGWESGRSVRI